MSREKSLQDLFAQVFSADELLAFLSDISAPGDDLTKSLPGKNSPLNVLIREATSALERRGLIDRKLFENIENIRPARGHEIRVVQNLWVYDGGVENRTTLDVKDVSQTHGVVPLACEGQVGDSHGKPTSDREIFCALFDYKDEISITLAMALTVESPDDTRLALGELAARISRGRGTDRTVSTRLMAEGFSPASDPPEIRTALIEYMLTAPLRMHVVLKQNPELQIPDAERENLLSGLLRSRLSKRGHNLRSILTTKMQMKGLKRAMYQARSGYMNVVMPRMAVEPASRQTVASVAEIGAQAVIQATLGNANLRNEFDRLRIKFAHIYDASNHINYRTDDYYPERP